MMDINTTTFLLTEEEICNTCPSKPNCDEDGEALDSDCEVIKEVRADCKAQLKRVVEMIERRDPNAFRYSWIVKLKQEAGL